MLCCTRIPDGGPPACNTGGPKHVHPCPLPRSQPAIQVTDTQCYIGVTSSHITYRISSKRYGLVLTHTLETNNNHRFRPEMFWSVTAWQRHKVESVIIIPACPPEGMPKAGGGRFCNLGSRNRYVLLQWSCSKQEHLSAPHRTATACIACCGCNTYIMHTDRWQSGCAVRPLLTSVVYMLATYMLRAFSRCRGRRV